jgi:sugar phosphate isomerase/epimerase
MKIGVCGSIDNFEGSVPGLDYVEVAVGGFLCPAGSDDDFQQEHQKVGTVPTEAANMLIPGDMPSTGPDVDTAALDQYMTTVCHRAAMAGIRVLVYGSGRSRRVPDGFDMDAARQQIADHLRRWNALAADARLTIVLEPLNVNDCNIAASVDEAAAIVRAADAPHCRLLVDTFHMAVNGEGPDAIARNGELIAHVHCAEGNGRGPLGTTGEDQRPMFRALKEAGYDGRVSIEAKWSDQQAQLPGALAELRRQIEEA